MAADDPAAVSAALAEAGRRLAAIREQIAALRDLPLWTVREQNLLTLTRDAESTLRSGYGVRLAGEISERGVAQTLSVRSPAQLLRWTRIHPPTTHRPHPKPRRNTHFHLPDLLASG
ncbi:MAG TPA: hypothetical protein VFM01_10700 [Nakamurella sp.]|nr:hypothetical protein [Nakamurella sp.]